MTTPFIVIPVTERLSCHQSTQQYTGDAAAAASAAAANTAKPSPSLCEVKRHLTITPEHSDWKHLVDVSDQKHARGAYRAITYTNQLQITGRFTPSQALLKPETYQTVHWEQARILLPISDLRGVYTMPSLRISEHTTDFELPTESNDLAFTQSALQTLLGTQAQTTLDFSITLSLDGLQGLSVQPLGKNIRMQMQANWPHPQFGGDGLPTQKSILADRFSAQWQSSFLASDNTQRLNACVQHLQHSACQTLNRQDSVGHWKFAPAREEQPKAFHISFIDPINIYSLTDRTLKYAALFLVMIFGVFFLFEVLKSLRVHPIQYALVGMAQAVFYLLLLSFSEHFSFAWAYLGSSVACVLLITWYVRYVLHGIQRALALGVILASAYTALYVILQPQQHALILGSVLVFVVIALVMYLTRRIDWYQLGSKSHD